MTLCTYSKVYTYIYIYTYLFIRKEKRIIKQPKVAAMVDQIFSMFFGEVVGFWSLFCHDFLYAMVYFDEPIAF